jgi:hypothetical protein
VVFFLGVRVTVESNFEHNFLHDVDAVAAVENPTAAAAPAGKGEAPYYENTMMTSLFEGGIATKMHSFEWGATKMPSFKGGKKQQSANNGG